MSVHLPLCEQCSGTLTIDNDYHRDEQIARCEVCNQRYTLTFNLEPLDD